MNSLCHRCKTRPRRGYHAWCQPCANAYMRKNRVKYADMTEEQQLKDRCRSHTHLLVKRGQLAKGPCERCGSTRDVEGHHPDYNKPREVNWLCRKCHKTGHDDGSVTAIAPVAPISSAKLPKSPGMTLGDIIAKHCG